MEDCRVKSGELASEENNVNQIADLENELL